MLPFGFPLGSIYCVWERLRSSLFSEIKNGYKGFKSTMTLFDKVSPNDVFAKVLDVFFDGKRDGRILDLAEMTR